MRRFAFTALLALALTVTAAFLLLPVLAIFLEVSPGRLLDQLGSDVALDAARVTLKTNAIALGLIVLFGTPSAYLLATRRFRGRALVVTLLELPLVLPPAVAGIGLLVAFGRQGLLGGTLDAAG
ncbi:MAG: molybdate ABC transporter permease subunit, partial [Gaiellaceae bacterium]